MMENFGSAAARHWEDAQRLHVIGRADNSAYLAGYAIECSLKVLIEITGPNPKALGHNLSGLSGDALVLACVLAPWLHRYQISRTEDFEHVMRAWVPEMRYSATGQVSGEQCERFLRAAKSVFQEIVLSAHLDGLVRQL